MTENGAIKYFYKRMELGDIENDTQQYAYETAIDALEENQKYKALGAVEELRIVKEKQIPKKPVMKPYFEDMEEEYLCCPTCGEILTDRIPNENKNFYFHCLNCGQAFDWGDTD